MIYRFLSPALEELADAATYYEEQVAGLGSDFLDEVDSAVTRILMFPEAWGLISDACRHCNLRRFPYTLIYDANIQDGILIVSVFHQNREPLSWERNI